MKNNRLRLIKNNGGSSYNLRERNRLIRLYNALRQKGGWRAVQKECGARNVAVVYNFALHGTEPKNIEDRKACGLIRELKPRSPFAVLPKWFERTKENLQWFKSKRQQVKVLYRNTRKPEEDQHEYEHIKR